MAKKGASYFVSIISILVIISLVASSVIFSLVSFNDVERIDEELNQSPAAGIDPSAMAFPENEPDLTPPTETP